jgi:demethylmenaquinone methyltransferase/2-methoxy-6-polyprenyl-1,4-benzoquinol methylase
MSDFTRVDRSVSAAGSYYSVLAPWYDFLASSEKRYIKKGLDLLDPQAGERILEIGFGTGYAQLRIADAVREGLSLGLDLSLGMAAIARKKLHRSGLGARAELVCSDSLPIPLSDSSIDGIFSSFTLELFDSPLIPDLLSECRRVLKPGGRLVAVSLSKDERLPWMGRLYETLHGRYPRLLDCRPIPLKDLLENSRFEVKRSRIEKMWGLPVIIALAIPASP